MGKLKDHTATKSGTVAEPREYLNRFTAFLQLLHGIVRSLRRKQLLVVFATFVVLLVVLQTELNSFLRGFHSVAPSDGNANVFEQSKTGHPESGTGRPRENPSLENKNSDPLAPGNANLDVPSSFLMLNEGGSQKDSEMTKKDDQDASQGQKANESLSRSEAVSAGRNVNDSDARNKAEEDYSSEAKADKKNTAESHADHEKEITSKSREKNIAETSTFGKASESLSAQNVINEGTINIIDNLHTGNRVKDVGYVRTKCFSASGQPQNHTCAPAVVIAGYEKCGTSALYYKLTKHPEIVAHPKWKENCPAEDSLKAMWSWFENTGTPALDDYTANGLLLNGCIGIVSKPLILRELQRMNPNLKVLAAFRNYADWAYSFYGYRCYPGYDEGCEKLKGPTSHGHWKKTRSPSSFAKLVTETSEAGKSPYEPFGVIEPNVNLFRQWLEELVDIVGRDAIRIVKQEDLGFSPRETLKSVANFLEIDASQFEDEAYSLISNTNDHPAEIRSVDANSSKGTVSAVINSGSAIYPDTRVQLNNFWKSECEWLRDNFDVHFSEVLFCSNCSWCGTISHRMRTMRERTCFRCQQRLRSYEDAKNAKDAAGLSDEFELIRKAKTFCHHCNRKECLQITFEWVVGVFMLTLIISEKRMNRSPTLLCCESSTFRLSLVNAKPPKTSDNEVMET